MADEKNSYLIKSDQYGSVRITPDGINTMAALAALDVEDVTSVGGNITKETVAKHSVKNLGKFVRTEVLENVISVDIAISLVFGSSIPTLVPQVQEKVKEIIENMTGLNVADVNVKIIGVDEEQA